MSTFKKSNIRSISLPTRSHPTTLRIEEELNKFNNLELSATQPTSITICNSFSSLEELYKCLEDLLNLQETQQVIVQHKLEKWVDELLDSSIKILDICGATKDLVSQMKEHLGDVQSSLRRRKCDSSTESSIARFTSFTKKIKKDAKKLIVSLKQMDSEICGSQFLNLDNHVAAVIRVVRQVGGLSMSVFQSLLVFLSAHESKSNQTKWSLVSNLMRKGQVDSENEFERANAALYALTAQNSSEAEKIQNAQNKLGEFENHVEEIEKCLECIFRRLIRTRALFLNIVSQ